MEVSPLLKVWLYQWETSTNQQTDTKQKRDNLEQQCRKKVLSIHDQPKNDLVYPSNYSNNFEKHISTPDTAYVRLGVLAYVQSYEEAS